MSVHSKQLPQFFLAILIAVVAASFLLRFQFDFNTGHMDEYDYLFVGKRLLSGQTWPSYTYIFGSDLNWYLLGLGERWQGISGARMVAAGFGLLSLLGIYWLVYSLWQRHLTAFIAAALLSIQSIQLFISRFATYDIISFACFSLALAPLLLACTQSSRIKYSYLLLSIVLMVLAITSKYVVVLYLPVVAGFAFFYSRRIGLLFGSAVGFILLGYVAVHWESLQVLYRVQIQGVHGSGNGSAQYIVETILTYHSGLLITWLLAVLWCMRVHSNPFWKQSTFKKLMLLLLLALPMLAYHLNALNMISLFKHLVYATLFLVPATAWLLTSFLESEKNNSLKQWLASSLILAMCALNYQQLKLMEVSYANVTPIIQQVEMGLDPNDTILSEDPYLFRYLASETLPQTQIKESGWLDNNFDGKHQHQDVIDAVWDQKFSYVYLNDQLHPELNKKLRNILTIKKYKPLVDKAYKISDVMSRQVTGRIGLYKRTGAPKLSLLGDRLFKPNQSMPQPDPGKHYVD